MIERVLIVLVLAIGIAAGGFFFGEHVNEGEWQAKEAKRLQDERDAQDAERLRADKASGAFQAELLAQRIATDQLEEAFRAYKRKHPIVVAAPAARRDPAATSGEAAPPGQCIERSDGVDLHLTLGAVWMWNSALVQRDAPAGACGLADPTASACAADSGIGVDEAFDNQALNARLCAEDRLRHQHLIDFIKNGGRK